MEIYELLQAIRIYKCVTLNYKVIIEFIFAFIICHVLSIYSIFQIIYIFKQSFRKTFFSFLVSSICNLQYISTISLGSLALTSCYKTLHSDSIETYRTRIWEQRKTLK